MSFYVLRKFRNVKKRFIYTADRFVFGKALGSKEVPILKSWYMNEDKVQWFFPKSNQRVIITLNHLYRFNKKRK
jgi:hypothetical protein